MLVIAGRVGILLTPMRQLEHMPVVVIRAEHKCTRNVQPMSVQTYRAQ